MGIRVALKDRARIKHRLAGVKVQGMTKTVPTDGPWFKCRLTIPEAAESFDGQGSRKTSRKAPSLMYDTVDAEEGSREPVVLLGKHKLEINSDDLGDGIWEVAGTPAPIRKKKRVIGWTVQLRQIEDQERE